MGTALFFEPEDRRINRAGGGESLQKRRQPMPPSQYQAKTCDACFTTRNEWAIIMVSSKND